MFRRVFNRAAQTALKNKVNSSTKALNHQSMLPISSVLSNGSASIRMISAAPVAAKKDMFCYQCEQTEGAIGCSTVGICGKTPETAALQDLLIHSVKGLSQYANRLRTLPTPVAVPANANRLTLEATFSTLTNVNFASERIVDYIHRVVESRDSLKVLYETECKKQGKPPDSAPSLGDTATWSSKGLSQAALVTKGNTVGVMELKKQMNSDDAHSIRQMITYGLKGMSAYTEHAYALGRESEDVYKGLHEAFDFLTGPKSTDVGANLGMALKVGGTNVAALAMLDSVHNARFGTPTPTPVNINPVAGKCILISGHDMGDLEALLQQTEGTGINVYTHGEMLPAHGYPNLKKFKHLAGNYGGAWQLQKFEFAKFPGPIVMTTNCLVEPRKTYKDRIWTMNAVGFSGVPHLSSRNFDAVIKKSKEMDGFTGVQPPPKTITVGFGHATILSVADKVIKGVEAGHISRVFVIGGCDGSEAERSYFQDLAQQTPTSSIILTAGCGKYRFNKLDLGIVPNVGLPRVLDISQCNDSYGAVVVALALAKHFKTDINGLPLSLAISWFEQKAVAVLLSLLHLGKKDIRLGPNLPAFVTPNVLKVLVDTFHIQPTNSKDVAADLKLMMAGK